MFVHHVQVRVSDIDATGMVRPGRFLDYLDDARGAFFAAPDNPTLHSSSAVVARTEIDFIEPLRYAAEPIDVALRVSYIGRSSFALAARIAQRGAVAARATTVLVTYDGVRRRSRTLSNAERVELTRWRTAAEE
ncbi:MAG TPA: thioesterase family protein [Candidatus Sulfotelmatobacter sp.]|nr:thioesterase family protein [Candidatus Sulfotelmatobacter sp.]